MSDEPQRLLGETEDGMERALLEAGREGGASPRAKERTLAALGLSAATAGGAVAARPWWSAGWVKLAGLAALGGALLVGAWALRRSQPSAPPADERAVAPTLAPTSEHTEPAHAVAPPAPEPIALPATPAEPPPRVRMAPVARAPIASVPTAAPSLAEEIATIDRARRALYDHDAHGALRALDEHDRRFPSGALAPEAQVLRVEALLAAGDRPGAEAVANRLLAASPSGPQAERVRMLLRR
jgi:TolA-binding protein